MTSYIVLLLAAVSVNMCDWRMLTLTCVVGIGIFLPIAGDGFYLICVVVEFGVALSAHLLAAPASRVIFRISGLLVIFHGLGWLFDGYPPASPYHIMVKISEHAELVACIVLSRPLTKMVTHV